ncbi:MAG: hypothetical protein IKW01_06535, partial [Firmicutes bacterium]|nr:hypothetical protein [Bacillota bacterium]
MDLNCMKINVKRIKAGMFTMLIIVAALIGRLFYIQMMCHEELAETAQAQYEITIEGMDTRGQIFDRNMKPLTGRVKQYYYIIKNRAENKRGVMLLENMGGRRLTSTNGKHLVYRTENFDRKVNERLKEEYGCYVFCSYGRYEENQLGCHLIGYLSDWEKKGVSGLEYMYENKLAASEGRFTVTADAAGNIIQGIAPEIKEERELLQDNYIITTIDYELQKKCESLLSGSAACVVADVYTGEILAMASSPGFNPGKISEYLDGDSDCLINKTLQSGYPPGSVFKLVTAAAALENGVCAAARTFECTGQVAVGGVQVSCATAPEGGHGTIDMAEAMACSCN